MKRTDRKKSRTDGPLFLSSTKPRSPYLTVSRPCSPAGRISMPWMNSSSGSVHAKQAKRLQQIQNCGGCGPNGLLSDGFMRTV